MREHGVLRRELLVYTNAAIRLRKNPADVAPDALQNTAKLFRAFGEDYHEKKDESQTNLVFLQGYFREFDGFYGRQSSLADDAVDGHVFRDFSRAARHGQRHFDYIAAFGGGRVVQSVSARRNCNADNDSGDAR